MRTTAIHDDNAAWTPAQIDFDACTLDLSPFVDKLSDNADAAMAAGRKMEEISASDFMDEALEESLAIVGRQICTGRGFYVLRGLPVEAWGERKSRLVLWGLGHFLGFPEAQDAAGSLIHDVRDKATNTPGATDGKNSKNGKTESQDLMARMAANKNIRGFQTSAALPFHTDGCDLFMLMCLRQGSRGGKTAMVSAVEAFNRILKADPSLALELQQPFHFDARGQRADGRRCQVHPIFHYHAGRMNIIAKEPYIQSAQRFPEVPRLTASQTAALNLFKSVTEDPEMSIELSLAPGEVIVCSNHSLVHGRTAFEDSGGERRKRHLLRLWLTSRCPRARALPPHYADTREHAFTYARRCKTVAADGAKVQTRDNSPSSAYADTRWTLYAPIALGMCLWCTGSLNVIGPTVRLSGYGYRDGMHAGAAVWFLLWMMNAYWLWESAGWLVRGTPRPRCSRSGPYFSTRSLFLLCVSESISMCVLAAILYNIRALDATWSIGFALATNLVGYLKYVYQMHFDSQYITLSFHIYSASFLWLSCLMDWDPLYFFLFRYPFALLCLIDQYLNMRGRQILLDEASISLHCADHLLHGIICCRVLLYHFLGLEGILWDSIVCPFVYVFSENLVKIQMLVSPRRQ